MAVTEIAEGVSFDLLSADARAENVLIEETNLTDLGFDTRVALELPEDYTYTLIPADSRTVKRQTETARYVITSISQASQQFIVNKVWDTVAGTWIRWATETIDLGGGEYPGPGIFGADTSDYRIETVKYTRS